MVARGWEALRGAIRRKGPWAQLGLFLLVTALVGASIGFSGGGDPAQGQAPLEGDQGREQEEDNQTKSCRDCHKAWQPPEIVLLAPKEVAVNTSFPVYGAVLNHGTPNKAADQYDDGYPYPTEGLALSLQLEGGLELESVPRDELGTMAAGQGRLWSLRGGAEPGTGGLVGELTGQAVYIHNTPQSDYYQMVEFAVLEPITLREVDLRVSTPLVLVQPSRMTSHELVLWTAGAKLENVTLGPVNSSQVQVVIELPPESGSEGFQLAPGRPMNVGLEVVGPHNTTVLLPVRWVDENGQPGLFNLTLEILPVARPAPEGVPRLIGRATGIFLLGVLAVAGVLGGTLGLRVHLNRLFSRHGSNARRRIRYHCWVAFGLFGMGLFHGVRLVLGPYSGLGLAGWGVRLWLGWANALTFGLLGLHGYFQVGYIRRRSFREWTRVHRGLAATALAMVGVHAILVGTDKQLVYLGLGVMGAAIVALGGWQNLAAKASRRVPRTGLPMVMAEPATTTKKVVVAKPIKVKCPRCRAGFAVRGFHQRARVQCPACSTGLVVRRPAQAPALLEQKSSTASSTATKPEAGPKAGAKAGARPGSRVKAGHRVPPRTKQAPSRARVVTPQAVPDLPKVSASGVSESGQDAGAQAADGLPASGQAAEGLKEAARPLRVNCPRCRLGFAVVGVEGRAKVHCPDCKARLVVRRPPPRSSNH